MKNNQFNPDTHTDTGPRSSRPAPVFVQHQWAMNWVPLGQSVCWEQSALLLTEEITPLLPSLFFSGRLGELSASQTSAAPAFPGRFHQLFVTILPELNVWIQHVTCQK